jgi:hypothetical protein
VTSQSSKAKTNGQSATYGKDKGCDYDPEHDRWEPQTSDAELHADAFAWQKQEAARLATECALLRPGANPATPEDLSDIRRLIDLWTELYVKLGGQRDQNSMENKMVVVH